MELSALSLQLRGLSVLRGLQNHPLVHAYLDAFDALGQDAAAFASRYGALCAAQFACRDASRALLDAVIDEQADNTRDALLAFARARMEEQYDE